MRELQVRADSGAAIRRRQALSGASEPVAEPLPVAVPVTLGCTAGEAFALLGAAVFGPLCGVMTLREFAATRAAAGQGFGGRSGRPG